MYRHLAPLGALVLLLLSACNPALNWREVQPAGSELKAMLPCKPDQGSRRQRLGAQEIELRMLGCEAGGAMFTVTVAELGPGQAAAELQQQWQAQSLAAMQARAATSVTWARSDASSALAPVRLQAQGLRPDGRPVVAQLGWLSDGSRLIHLAIYADRIHDDMSATFFSGLARP